MTIKPTVLIAFFALSVAVFASEADDLFVKGDAAYKAKDFGTALDLFQKAAKLAPESAKFRYNVGLAARKLNKYTVAAESFQIALELDPAVGFTSDKEAFRQKLEEMQRLSDSTGKEGTGAGEFVNGEAAYKNGDYEGAYILFGQAAAKQPGTAKYRYNLGLACRKLKKYGEALAEFTAAKSIDPDITFTNDKSGFESKVREMESLAPSDAGKVPGDAPRESRGTPTEKKPRARDMGNLGLWGLGLAGAGIWLAAFLAKRKRGTGNAERHGQHRAREKSRPDDGFDGRYDDYRSSHGSVGTRDHS